MPLTPFRTEESYIPYKLETSLLETGFNWYSFNLIMTLFLPGSSSVFSAFQFLIQGFKE